jgi:hypothetical protein
VNGHPIALLDTQFLQSGRKTLGAFQQGSIRHGGIHEAAAQGFNYGTKVERRPVGVLTRRVKQELMHRTAGSRS